VIFVSQVIFNKSRINRLAFYVCLGLEYRPVTDRQRRRVRGSATGEAQWPIGPWTMGRGIAPPPPSDAAINWLMDVFNGGQRPGLRRRDARVETRAGNAMKEGVTIVDRTLGTGDQRPTVGTLKSR